MDADQRVAWRKRLSVAYPWCCSICKTAYASQEQFEQMGGVVELVRHSECGHVLFWRSRGSDFLTKYLADRLQTV